MTTSSTYAISHVVGTSPESLEAAIDNALTTAAKTIRNLNWFEVDEIRGHLSDEGKVLHYQVTLKLGFRYDD